MAIRETDHLKWLPVTVLPEVSHLGRYIHMYTHLLIPSHSPVPRQPSSLHRIAREILDHPYYRIYLIHIEQWPIRGRGTRGIPIRFEGLRSHWSRLLQPSSDPQVYKNVAFSDKTHLLFTLGILLTIHVKAVINHP